MWVESRGIRWAGRFIAAVFALVAVLMIDFRPSRIDAPPQIIEVVHAEGALRAGAAKANLVPSFPAPIGGFATRGNAPFEGVLDAPQVRALILDIAGKRVAFVSAELLLLPAAFREKVAAATADLGLAELLIGATHSHSSVGGYWNQLLAQWIGLASYDSKIESFLVGQVSQALHQAAQELKPARIASGRIDASNYGMNRNNPQGATDKLLTALHVDGLDGAAIGKIVVFAAHPTIVHRDSMRLSGDWPSYLMTALEEDGHAPALFFQGAVGDTTWAKRSGALTLEDRVARFGQAIAADARGALAAGGEATPETAFTIARARVNLPACDVGGALAFPFNRVGSNLMQWFACSRTADVSFFKLGSLTVASVPAEIVADLALAWRLRLDGATYLGLMDDYIGYVETPERIEARTAEAQRSYFGPTLAPVLLEGLLAAKTAVDGVKK